VWWRGRRWSVPLNCANGVQDKRQTLTLVDETRDTLDTSSTSETPDSGLGDSLDVVSQDLSVSLSASLTKTYQAKAWQGGSAVELERSKRVAQS
jgi:hypothetical protein